MFGGRNGRVSIKAARPSQTNRSRRGPSAVGAGTRCRGQPLAAGKRFLLATRTPRQLMGDAFPAELRHFIAVHVESLAQLEAMLLLRQEPGKAWQSNDLAQRLYITPDMCAALLADLQRRGFASKDPPS